MSRTLDQVVGSLGSIYDPQIQSIQQQQQALPGQQAAEEAGLDAKKNTAFDDIVNAARRRGTGIAFGGIPLADQARYTATDYLPAVARLRTAYKQQATSLQDAISQIYERRNTQAQGIYDNERAFEEQQRQFNEDLAFRREQAAAAERQAAAARAASASGSFSPTLGGNYSAPAQNTAAPVSAQTPSAQHVADYGFVKGLISQVNGGNGTTVAMILSQAKAGDPRSKDVMRAFYQLQNKPIPANFRSFL